MDLLLGILGIIGGLLCAIGDILFYFLCLVIIPSFLLEYAIIRGYLQLPVWCALLTSVPLMAVGIGLRLIKKEWFNDLPGIIMPSIGISMVGLLAAINTIL
jgi:hypothetical protein